MGMRKEIKKATKVEMKALEKRINENPFDAAALSKWRTLQDLLESFKDKS